MGYAITVLLGNTKTFCKAYYIAAGNGWGLKLLHNWIAPPNDYIAARNGGGLKHPSDHLSCHDYIAAGNGGQ